MACRRKPTDGLCAATDSTSFSVATCSSTQKGYSQTIYYNPGEDDLFLTQIADSGNTAVQLNPDAVLVQDWEDRPTNSRKNRKNATTSRARCFRNARS